jgi:very-short-patch-repair endonuclease
MVTFQIIQKAKHIHGDKYNYSKVIYKNSKTPIIIICNTCGNEFEQLIHSHFRGNGGCKECHKNKSKNNMSFTTEEFIKKATQIHDCKYDYSQVNYINSETHVVITCISCNYSFNIIPNNHFRGRGCKKCANKLKSDKKRKTKEQFVLQSNSIHKDKYDVPIYDYSFVEYITNNKKVNIICKTHGTFEQTPSSHLQGKGCKKCAINDRSKKQTFTKEEFIQKATQIHGDKYNYSKVNYINSQNHIIVICNICDNYFTQAPNSHLQGCGCNKCAHNNNHEKQKLTNDEIIKRATQIHGVKFDYTYMNYKNSHSSINIKCNQCNNMFQQIYRNHIKNKGCPLCEYKITEKMLYDYLISIYPNVIREFKQEWCKNKKHLPFDMCISEFNIIIELDGPQHFEQIHNWKSPEETQSTDIYKMKCANENKYSVIRILQIDVIDNKYNWKEELLNNIEKIKKNNIIQNIFMCKYNEYDILNTKIIF